MNTHTIIDPTAIKPLYSAEWLYDELMAEIEPELMIINIDMADELHADETAEERAKRYAHYAESFKTYEDCLKDLADLWREDATIIKKAMDAYARTEVRRSDDEAANNIAQSIDSSDI